MSRVETVEHLTKVPSRPRRRWRVWLGGALLLLVLGLVIAYGFFAYRMDQDLREAMAQADRDHPGGWQLEDIEARREQVPDELNAALVAWKVKSLLPASWPREIVASVPEGEEEDKNGAGAPGTQPSWDERLHDLSPEVQLDAAALRGLRESLARVEPARAEARKLIGMTHGRFPLVWDENVFLTKIQSQDARSPANLLRYEAALASQDGDADGAVAFVRGLVGSARSVGDEPTLISVLIRIACDGVAVAALERALAQGEPSERELEAVQALLEKEAAEPLLVQAMRGERAGMHKTLLAMQDGTVSLSQITGATGVDKMVLEVSGPTLARRSHGYFLRLLNEYVEAAQLPPEAQLPLMKNVEQKVIKAKLDYDVVTSLLMPAMLKVSEANRSSVGNLRCAFVAVALERYRRAHGGWPDSLDALVPQYLTAVPADPQDGKPLRFKRRPDGVIVYWIGLDGIDDGGKLNRHKNLAQTSDQGFQLWDVKQRRQPGRELLPQPAEEAPP